MRRGDGAKVLLSRALLPAGPAGQVASGAELARACQQAASRVYVK